MSRANTKLAAIAKRLPKGAELPAEFPAFVSLVTHATNARQDALRVAWSDFTELLNVDKAAVAEFLPFLKRADGGGVAFWMDGGNQHIAVYDSEGGYEIVAVDFRDFLARLGTPTEEFRELIELDVDLDTSELIPATTPKPVPEALNDKLKAWIESHSLSAPILKSAEGEELRKTLVAMAERMVADGLSKVYTPRSVYWKMDLVLEKQGESWRATYLDYGKWRDLPAKYELIERMPALLPLMKSRKARYALNIMKGGEVFADGGNELALVP
ncbi:hypothetical protein ACFPN2_22450 [Steroidobacter flavus]|uniref:Knr4/Smi1-like domain-containing protein n=1 Tax=Steroidobacter flavus TaxID=1842136 RepID=A0ABV8SZS7_9GAMM